MTTEWNPPTVLSNSIIDAVEDLEVSGQTITPALATVHVAALLNDLDWHGARFLYRRVCGENSENSDLIPWYRVAAAALCRDIFGTWSAIQNIQSSVLETSLVETYKAQISQAVRIAYRHADPTFLGFSSEEEQKAFLDSHCQPTLTNDLMSASPVSEKALQVSFLESVNRAEVVADVSKEGEMSGPAAVAAAAGLLI